MKRHRGSYRGYYSNNSGTKLKVIVRKEDEMEVYNGVESMIDLKNGTIKIADGLTISPDYTFDKFKKSSFYKNQDGIRIIYLEKQQVIDGINYMVSLFLEIIKYMWCHWFAVKNSILKKMKKKEKNFMIKF